MLSTSPPLIFFSLPSETFLVASNHYLISFNSVQSYRMLFVGVQFNSISMYESTLHSILMKAYV